VLWKVPALGDRRLGLYVGLPGSVRVVGEPRGVFHGSAYVERWSISEPAALVGSTIRIDGLRTTLTDVLVRIERLVSRDPNLYEVAEPDLLRVAGRESGHGRFSLV
jgi:hypothetical protein